MLLQLERRPRWQRSQSLPPVRSTLLTLPVATLSELTARFDATSWPQWSTAALRPTGGRADGRRGPAGQR
ncbi:MAG: hypothetical protein R2838_01000 [Caldilineaceae bacterium]